MPSDFILGIFAIVNFFDNREGDDHVILSEGVNGVWIVQQNVLVSTT